MTNLRIDNVTSFEDRHGTTRYRFRKKGLPTRYLPGKPGDAAFMAALQLARDGEDLTQQLKVSRARPGSIQALINAYYRSPDYRGLRDTTQTVYRRMFDKFAGEYGHLSVAGLKRSHIKKIMGKMSDRPGAADSLLKRLKTLMGFALDIGMIDTDPTLRMKGYNKRTDGHRTWTEAEVAKFKKAYPSGSRERMALVLLLSTASRGGDAVRLGPNNIWNGRLRWKQSKTGAWVSLQIWDELRAEIEKSDPDADTYITQLNGKPYTVKSFQQWFAKRVRMIGIIPEIQPDGAKRGCTAHGLRKVAAVRLADAGCTIAEIQAITGHKTASEVARYTEGRDRELAADAAHEKASLARQMANPDTQVAKSDDNQLKTKEN